MDLRQLKSIIKEFEDSKVFKLEITEKDLTVKLEKEQTAFAPVSSQYIPTEPVVSVSPVSNEEKNTTIEINNFVQIKAPLVGTFYDSPSPDSGPFVVLNQNVNKGDVLFIVEAMKVMNEITSPVSGVVKCIHVQNATMVEYGQVVMEIEE
jgi:acetyl-CoA carboxylase biotin carboxyl carrier protein